MTQQWTLALTKGRCWQGTTFSSVTEACWLGGGLVGWWDHVGRWRTESCFVLMHPPHTHPQTVASNYPLQWVCNDIKIEVWMGNSSRECRSADPESSTRERGESAEDRGVWEGGEWSCEQGSRDGLISSTSVVSALRQTFTELKCVWVVVCYSAHLFGGTSELGQKRTFIHSNGLMLKMHNMQNFKSSNDKWSLRWYTVGPLLSVTHSPN